MQNLRKKVTLNIRKMDNTCSRLLLGLDIGSTTVKVVAVEPKTKNLLFSRYRRHNAYQIETLRSLLGELYAEFPDTVFRAAVCGSGGKPAADAIGIPYVQEVAANAIAVRNLYPTAKVAVELGGQDAKLIFFYHDKTTNRLIASDMRMNGNCAGGTGAFIDEVAKLLRVPVEEFEALAAKGTSVYDISGRCGVFAKTDIQPLLNQGGLREDIALSTFHAIAKQTIGGLAQGLEIQSPIIFEGGPLTFNPTLIRVFEERLALKSGDSIRPKNPETLVALGAALSTEEMFADIPQNFSLEDAVEKLGILNDTLHEEIGDTKNEYFSSPEDRADFERTHKMEAPPHHNAKRGDTLRVYLGIDAGSTTSKFVLIDEDENVIDSFYSNNHGDPLRVVRDALAAMKQRYDDEGITLEVLALGTTGYGELLFDKAFGADYHTVETVAHAAAAQKYVPGVSFILDIGGQDMKAITISNDIVTNITLNEACSSGCGSFLENFASTLKIPVSDIADAAFRAKNPAVLGSRCTVFMTSTIITEQRNGKTPDEIMAGLCRSIIENVFTKVVRMSNFSSLGEVIMAQGGTFKNDAVLRALEQYIGKHIVRAPYPGEMGAIGTALLTRRHITENGYTSPHGTAGQSRFIGLDAMQSFDYTQKSNVKCTFCSNNCSRTLVTFSNGLTWVTGNRCTRGEIVDEGGDAAELKRRVQQMTAEMDKVSDLFTARAERVFADYPAPLLASPRKITIGLPRALDFWGTMPFWKTFFTSLGFTVKLSRPSSRQLFEKGLQFIASDTVCFPAKLAHGHIHDLAGQGVDRIFMPMMNHQPTENTEERSTYTCSVVKGYPLVIGYSDNPAARYSLPFDTPMFHWFKKRDRDYQLCRYMQDTYGVQPALTRKAIRAGDGALKSFKSGLAEEGAKILEQVEKDGAFAVVLAARHYQNDELINHRLSRYFTNLGIPVLTLDSLPGIEKTDLTQTRPDIIINSHARILAGAMIAAKHPNLEYVQIVSFSCGHDAVLSDEVCRLMNDISGKAPLILKLDESDVSGPLRIRVNSFVETVRTRRKKEAAPVRPLPDPFAVKFTKQDRVKTILIPNCTKAMAQILTAVIRKQGFRVEPLPMGSIDAIQLGKKYVHNDICFPAQMIIGESLSVLKSGVYNPDDVVVGMAKTQCDCRLTNYAVLVRKALDEAGYPQIPIVTTDFFDHKNMHPGYKFGLLSQARTLWCLIMADILENLRRKIRPYELHTGDTDRIFEESITHITGCMQKKGFIASLGAFKKAVDAFCAISYDRTRPKPLVFITGEFLLNHHSGSNFYIERYLEKNNMEVALPFQYDEYRQLMYMHTLSEIKDFHVHHKLSEALHARVVDGAFNAVISIMERVAVKHPLFTLSVRLPQLAEISNPVIPRSFCSGESFLIAADIMHNAEAGVKSFILLQPFGCLPNHIGGRGLVKRLKELYPAIQILPLDYDPDTSFANIENRLQMLIINAKNTV
ncbi:2-hydroxyglutaryl-CoA dehydratase [Spirochaetia bacterium]|nr:2-hydroxyglutaryl-CoA dehydratase [Spirochaetia bacterium]